MRTATVADLRSSAAYLLVGVALAGLLIAGGGAIYRVQGGVAEIAPLLPFGYAYAAGMVAAVNPCGVLFLPSLAAYYLGGAATGPTAWWSRSTRAIGLGLVATAGFLLLFTAVGLVFGLGGRALGAYFPIGGTAAGVLLVGLGTWAILTNRSLGLAQASRAVALFDVNQGRSIFGLGIGYGIASLACTLPVFLAVVGTSLAAGSGPHAVSQFLGYALGMGTVVTGVLLATAFFEQTIRHLLRRIVPHVHRLAAAFLVAAGLYIISYWASALTG